MALSLRMVFSFSVLVLLVFTMGCAAVGGISDPVELSNISAAVGVELKFTCEDNIQNGQEVDVDCGGDQCPECKSGKRCLKDTDCVSGKCERPHMFSDRSSLGSFHFVAQDAPLAFICNRSSRSLVRVYDKVDSHDDASNANVCVDLVCFANSSAPLREVYI